MALTAAPAGGLPPLAGNQLPNSQAQQQRTAAGSGRAGDSRSALSGELPARTQHPGLRSSKLQLAHRRRRAGAKRPLPGPGDSANRQGQLARCRPPLPRPNRAAGGTQRQPRSLDAVYRASTRGPLAPQHPAGHHPHSPGRGTPTSQWSLGATQAGYAPGLLPALQPSPPPSGGRTQSPCRRGGAPGAGGEHLVGSNPGGLAPAASRGAARRPIAAGHLLAKRGRRLAGPQTRPRWLPGAISRPGTNPGEIAGL